MTISSAILLDFLIVHNVLYVLKFHVKLVYVLNPFLRYNANYILILTPLSLCKILLRG